MGDFVVVTNAQNLKITGAKPDQKLYERKIQAHFDVMGKKWKVINFEREARKKPVATFEVGIEGKT